MDKKKKDFIQTYINRLQQELNSFSEGNSDESSVFDIIVEIKGVFAADFPDLDANLSFNNGSAIRDAKIVLGLLNKILIEDFVSEDIDNAEYEESMNDLQLSFEGIRATVGDYTKEGLINNYLNQLSKAIENQDIKNIKKLLNLVYDWYCREISKINQNEWCFNKEEHREAMNIVKTLITRFTNIPDDYIAKTRKNILQNLKQPVTKNNIPLIFISHSSSDKKYGDALRKFIIGLGVKDDQLIYTSHPLNKIPLDKNIYEYLRENFNNKVFMIILWSDAYLESPACLNEMGAAWVTQSDYTNIYNPNFTFGNPKYHQCAVDTRKMGAVLRNDEHCKTNMIELKDKILKMFNLEIDEKHFMVLLDEFMKEIM